MPGTRMPELQGAVAAVGLAALDQEKQTASVSVRILAPARLGGESCEDLAVTACGILQGLGGVCRLEPVRQLDKTAFLQAEITAVFSGSETAEGWAAKPAFTVNAGSTALGSVTAFTAWREQEETDGVVTEVADAQWHFALEELFALDAAEEDAPSEPFSVTVSREGRTEVYSGCTLTAVKRSITPEGQRQVRQGLAESLTVS